jgi:hypothetical protein
MDIDAAAIGVHAPRITGAALDRFRPYGVKKIYCEVGPNAWTAAAPWARGTT